MKLSCVACQKPLKNYMAGSGVQPDNGLAFVTYGHYGSTVFDPMDGSFLELCICDDCLSAAGERGAVYEGHGVKEKIKTKYNRWPPQEEKQ